MDTVLALLLGARTLLRAPGIATRSILTTSNKKLLGAPGLTTSNKCLTSSNKKLLGARHLTTNRFILVTHLSRLGGHQGATHARGCANVGRRLVGGKQRLCNEWRLSGHCTSGILLLVAMPFAPSNFLFLVVRPGATTSVLAHGSDAFVIAGPRLKEF